jgi:flagellar biosynthesis chaperone FliJ
VKNIAQIKVINDALTREKERFMGELARINIHLENKLNTLHRFMEYIKDYNENANYSMSRTIPALNRNLDSFSKKLQQLILVEEKEVEKLTALRAQKIKHIEEIEQKIKVMDHFETIAVTEKQSRMERSEQAGLDELNSIKHSRGEYE